MAVTCGYDDYANRLIGRTLDADGSAGTGDIQQTVYSYDGSQIALQFDKTYANGSASDLTATDLSHRYLWNSQAVDHLFADEQMSPLPSGEGQGEGYDLTTPGDVLWALTDHQGTVRDLATYDSQNDVTTIANHRVYDAYGNLQSETNSAVDCLFGYTGRPYDEATGLQNNLNRWYDAGAGRWMSQDPIGFAGRDANLCRYVANTTMVAADPTGLDRYVVFEWGHMYILVDIWNKEGTQVIGYMRLDVNFLEYSSRRVNDEEGGSVWEILRSNACQDRALINYWDQCIKTSENWFWNWEYNVIFSNCWDKSHYWSKYGGPARPPINVTDYMTGQPDPGPSPKTPGITPPAVSRPRGPYDFGWNPTWGATGW